MKMSSFNWSDAQSYNFTWCLDVEETEETTNVKFILETFAFILNIPFLLFICIVGAVGNALCAFVLLSNKFRKSSFYILLGSLAIVDCLNLIAILLLGPRNYYRFIGCFNMSAPFWKSGWERFLDGFLHFVGLSIQSSSFYILMLINVERFVAVFYPLKVKILFTTKRTTCIILWTFLICFIAYGYFIPSMILYLSKGRVDSISTAEEACSQYPGNGTAFSICMETYSIEKAETYEVLFNFMRVTGLIGGFFVPFGTILILNCLIVYGIRRAKKERQNLSQRNRRGDAGQDDGDRSNDDLIPLTSMVLKITSVYFVCCVITTIFIIHLVSGSWSFFAFLGRILFFVLIAVNSAANPVIYSTQSTAVRTELKRILCPWF